MLKPTTVYLVMLERPVGKSIVTDARDAQEAVEFAEWAYKDALKDDLEICAVYIARFTGSVYDQHGQLQVDPNEQLECYLSPEGHVKDPHDWHDYLEQVAFQKTWTVPEQRGEYLS